MIYRNLSHSVSVITTRLRVLLGSINRLYALWWGVQLGKRSVFIGKSSFNRFPGTEITIGERCTFLSSKTSNRVGINRPCMISTLPSTFRAKIKIGHHCGFSGTVIGAFKYIQIGNGVRCGANTTITDSDWHPDDPRSGPAKDVIIGDNVWLGVNCIVLKGVVIGENTVIGANSVVSKSIPANVIAAGNPCKVVRDLSNGK